jgi:hypothetical protein
MSQKMSRFQERLALLIGGTALFGLVMRKRLPYWTEAVLLGTTGLLLQVSLGRLGSKRRGLDIVTEASEESLPASDPPAWVLGAR